jgi:hypothetical protein
MKNVITIKWCIEDVLEMNISKRHKLTKQEARDVLSLAKHKHDANIGINWDVLAYHVSTVVDERKK